MIYRDTILSMPINFRLKISEYKRTINVIKMNNLTATFVAGPCFLLPKTKGVNEVQIVWMLKFRRKLANNFQIFKVFMFREALQKTGVNIKPILLRLKDR